MPSTTYDKAEDAKKFCEYCEWLHRCWSMSLAVHEAAIRPELLPDGLFWESPAGLFLQHHGKISSEYTLLQFAKLHDRPSNRRNKNLVIGYFTQCEDWRAREYRQVDQISLRLNEFYRTNIRDVRNKILAHNDLETYRKNTLLGKFYEAEGEAYLRDLGQLATMVWTRWHCEMDRPYQNATSVFDFSPKGQARRECKEVAEGAVDCVQLGYRKLNQRQVASS